MALVRMAFRSWRNPSTLVYLPFPAFFCEQGWGPAGFSIALPWHRTENINSLPTLPFRCTNPLPTSKPCLYLIEVHLVLWPDPVVVVGSRRRGDLVGVRSLPAGGLLLWSVTKIASPPILGSMEYLLPGTEVPPKPQLNVGPPLRPRTGPPKYIFQSFLRFSRVMMVVMNLFTGCLPGKGWRRGGGWEEGGRGTWGRGGARARRERSECAQCLPSRRPHKHQ